MTPAPVDRRVIVACVRAWSRFYTFGLPDQLRERRLHEIESDLWEERHDSIDRIGGFHVASRLVRGIVDDIQWRSSVATEEGSARWTVAAMVAAAIVISSLWLILFTSGSQLPPPPAAPDLVTRRMTLPPPPPPPPPPCNPAGIGRPAFSPCTPY